MAHPGIGIVGSTTIDKIVGAHSQTYQIGGVTAYAGLTYRRQDIPTHVVTNVGKNGSGLIDMLKKKDIAVYGNISGETTRFENHVTGKKRCRKMPSKAEPITPAQIQQILDRAACLHLGPLHPDDIDPGALELLKQWGGTIGLDIQGYVRMIAAGNVTLRPAGVLPDALSVAHIVKANEIECEVLMNACAADIQNILIRYGIEELIVTCGEKGGYVSTRAGQRVDYAAVPVKKVIDPTGAGDVFFAAYLACRIFHNDSIAEACTHAAEKASGRIAGEYIRSREIAVWDAVYP